MFDINMHDLSDLPNKVTYCNGRTGNMLNGTENNKFHHNHNIVNFISIYYLAAISYNPTLQALSCLELKGSFIVNFISIYYLSGGRPLNAHLPQ